MKLFGGTIGWRANKQDTVTTSTTEAELLGLAQATKEAIYASRLIKELGVAAASLQHNATVWEDAFRQSRWFTRGWTLQELIAPKTVEFYSKEKSWLGDKHTLEPLVRDITGIPASALRGTPLSDFTVAEREV